ncbi:MAG: MAE_28990/MAE_18760 family HEPN-like nuclease [Deltaproteobacteria bacterium]|nr:MAE_28990/MAE_18760 family HEPN-like nuclease [Deltaproteobacteria bacterium]
MTIRTLSQLVDVLDKDVGWRKRELTTVKFMLANRRAHQTEALLRAAICLLYAHWEGFVQTATTGYVTFVANQGLRYRDLAPNFVALALRREIVKAGQTERPTIHNGLVEKLMTDSGDRLEIEPGKVVPKQSNVNLDRLREILALLGLDEGDYLSKGVLLDRKLLANRNEIAHGGRTELQAEDYEGLQLEVVELVERFNNDVQNAAATGRFRRAGSQ